MNVRFLKFISLPIVLVCSTAAYARSTPQCMWTLPSGARFEELSERPGNRLGVYWQGDLSWSNYERVSILDSNGKVIQSGAVPGQLSGNPMIAEDWNARGQHAFLPGRFGDGKAAVQLKTKNGYRALQCLPLFDHLSLEDMRFSPDGECLYVLGSKKLWVVGAQSARLLRVIKPYHRKSWSDENAVLSPDCRRILTMRDRMTLCSARSGKVLSRFGKKVETFYGHCGDMEARLSFSRDGRHAVVSKQDISDYETWVYPAGGGKLCWHGRTPYEIRETARGHFFLDAPRIDDYGATSTVLRRWRDGKVGWSLKINFDDSEQSYDSIGPPLIFSRDGRWIYFYRDSSVWRVAMPKLS